MSRGVRRQALFRDDEDRTTFLMILAEVIRGREWACLAFCLLTTHYHLLVRTPAGDLAVGMQRLNSHFAQAFNRRHGERGHVFERRYRSVLVDRDPHLLELYRYFALNPVRAGLAAKPENWEWGSYAMIVGDAPRLSFVNRGWILPFFGREPRRARERLRAFVEDGASSHFRDGV
jgi:REP element-mobilizing transposase RayT